MIREWGIDKEWKKKEKEECRKNEDKEGEKDKQRVTHVRKQKKRDGQRM